MIILNNEQIEKTKLLDKFFNSLSIEQLKTLTELDRTAWTLRGTDNNVEIFSQLFYEYERLCISERNLNDQISLLKTDLSLLIKLVLKPYDDLYINGAKNLKNKYGIY